MPTISLIDLYLISWTKYLSCNFKSMIFLLKFISDMRMRILSSSVQICPQYDDFSFTNWDLNVEVRELFTLAQKYVRKMSVLC